MMPSTLACPLDIPEQTLSAWRDGLLDPAESRRLEGHVASCAACQSRLAAFDRVGLALRSQGEPDLRDYVWRGLQMRLAAQGDTGRDGRRDAGHRSPGPTIMGRGLGTAAVAAIAAVLVVALFAAALASRPGHPSTPGITGGSPTATASPAVTPTASPTLTSAQVPQGWTAAAIGSGVLPDVAFAPSSPATGYAVIVGTNGSASVSGTRDSGATWRHLATPVPSGQDRCEVSVDPTDAKDVALVCTPPASSGYSMLRSTDGGATWTKPVLGVTVNCYTNMGWAGGTLLLTFALCDGGSTQTQLIASAGKGQFKRLDSDGAVSDITLAPEIRLLTGHGSTYYVQMGAIGYNPTQLDDTLLVSTNGGATWKAATLADGGQRMHLYGVSPDGRSWAAVYDNAPAQLALSTDDGATWHNLPRPWSDEIGPANLFVTPDGTVLVTDARAGLVEIPNTLYMAAPGTSQWTAGPAMSLRDTFPRAVSYDASGHAKSLWARFAASAQGGDWKLISHPL